MFGLYELDGLLGQGGMGRVHREGPGPAFPTAGALAGAARKALSGPAPRVRLDKAPPPAAHGTEPLRLDVPDGVGQVERWLVAPGQP